MKIKVFILLAVSLCVWSRDVDDDEGRPYEFGFTIDGQQHRHESKDVNGIVMGEFGFITADGIYHVTVYATDENGSFKILSMRNVRVSGPLDDPNYEFPKKIPSKDVQREAPPPATTTTIAAPTTVDNKAPYTFTTPKALNVPACSSCKLPSTTPKPLGPPGSNDHFFQTPEFKNGGNGNHKNPPGNAPAISPVPSGPTTHPEYINFPPYVPSDEQLPPHIQTNPNVGSRIPDSHNAASAIPTNSPDDRNIVPPFNQPPFAHGTQPSSPELNHPVDYYQKRADPAVRVEKDKIVVPGREVIPITDRYPNMVDGLPAGITENDMLDLLYKFNYTLGFHGHHERGLKNGAKIGAYFVNGRDGISRVVEYIADENGYRPKVKFINLGLDSPDTPKEGTEKTFGLKGFEFVWYPV